MNRNQILKLQAKVKSLQPTDCIIAEFYYFGDHVKTVPIYCDTDLRKDRRLKTSVVKKLKNITENVTGVKLSRRQDSQLFKDLGVAFGYVS